jgi:hypothetical protein
METFPLVVGISLAVGVWMIAHSILNFCFDLGSRWYQALTRRRYRLLSLGIGKMEGKSRGEDELLGLEKIPWLNLYAGSALLGLALFIFIGPAVPRVRLGFLALPAFIWLFKGFLARQRRRFLLGQIRQLLIDIRLHMSLCGSLLLGLENIARTTDEKKVVYRALRHRMLGGQAKNGLEVLGQLAKDLKSAHLTRITQRIQAAQTSGGILDVDQAIATSIDELTDEINGQTEEQMQRLPLRITLLAMPFLLGPIVILVFYPLVDRILNTLSGTAIGGGF